MKKDDVTDAEFEVITGPSPVEWQPQRKAQKPKTPLHEWLIAGFFGLLALYVAVLGLAGADLDTRDDVEAWKARQPVAATIR